MFGESEGAEQKIQHIVSKQTSESTNMHTKICTVEKMAKNCFDQAYAEFFVQHLLILRTNAPALVKLSCIEGQAKQIYRGGKAGCK